MLLKLKHGWKHTWWRHTQDDVEPDVRKDAPRWRCRVDKGVFNLSHFSVRNDVVADARDDEEIEGGRANNRPGPKMSGLETFADNFDDGKQDFGSGWSEDHQTEIGHRFVPDLDFDGFNLTRHFVYDLNLFLLISVLSITYVIATVPITTSANGTNQLQLSRTINPKCWLFLKQVIWQLI